MACDLFWTRPFPPISFSLSLKRWRARQAGREGPAEALAFAWQGICVIGCSAWATGHQNQ